MYIIFKIDSQADRLLRQLLGKTRAIEKVIFSMALGKTTGPTQPLGVVRGLRHHVCSQPPRWLCAIKQNGSDVNKSRWTDESHRGNVVKLAGL